MREVFWSKAFKRSVKSAVRRNPALRQDIEMTLRLLQENPFAPPLASHKLKGKLLGLWACSVGYDLRIIFEFVKPPDRSTEDIVLLGLGTHDEVY